MGLRSNGSFYAVFSLLSFVPPAVVGILAWYIGRPLPGSPGPFSGHFLALVIALWSSAVISAIFAVCVLIAFFIEINKPTAKWLAGLAIVLIPLFVLYAAVAGGIVGWGLAEIGIQIHRVISNATGIGDALLQCLLPAVAVGIVLYILRIQIRPALSEKISRLCKSERGARKLETMYRVAVRRNDQKTLEALGKTPKLPPSLLRLMAENPDPIIRSDVANNSNTPPDVLNVLIRDTSQEVRRAIIYNSAVTIPMLEILAQSPEEELRKAAQTRLDDKRAE